MKRPEIYLPKLQHWIEEAVEVPLHSYELLLEPDEPFQLPARPQPIENADKERTPGKECVGPLTQRMVISFPGLKYTLGEELFMDLCREYVRNYITMVNNDHFNPWQHFFSFLKHVIPNKEVLIRKTERWPDLIIAMARMEWVMSSTYEKNINNVYAMRPSAQGSLLQVNNTLQLMHFHFPVHKYYKAIINGDMPPLPTPRETFLATTRIGDTINICPVMPFEYLFLQQLTRDKTIADAIHYISNIPGMDSQKALIFWKENDKRWRDLGLLNEIGDAA